MSGGNPFRVPYGFAIGRANAFQYTFGPTEGGTAGLIKKNSVTADVTIGTLFYTDNSSGTVISGLTSGLYSSNTGYNEGRIIRIMMLDTATQIDQSGNIVLAGTGNFGSTGRAPVFIDLMQSKSKWYEVSRSNCQDDFLKVNLAGTTNCSVNADGVSTLIVAQTSATTQLVSISGGYVGQTVNIVFVNSAASTVTVTTGGNLMFENTAGIVVRTTGGAFAFVKVGTAGTADWYMLAGNSKKLN